MTLVNRSSSKVAVVLMPLMAFMLMCCRPAGGQTELAFSAQDGPGMESAAYRFDLSRLDAGATALQLPDAPSALMAKSDSDGGVDAVDKPGAIQSVPVASLPASKATSKEGRIEHEWQRNSDCETFAGKSKPCHVMWWKVLGESVFFLAAQHGGNIALDSDTRYNLTHGSYWGDYAYCVEHYRWYRWKDDDPFGVDYVGHPMMGAFTSSIYEQNDPKQRALVFENSRRYWNGRLKAMAYSAAYSAQWKIGPASEASIGNTGIGYYIRQRDGLYTNETGMQDFFITPIGGLAWNVGEDVIDKYLFRHVIHAHKNKMLLLAASLMTPMRAGANVSRFRAPYYRDLDLQTETRVKRYGLCTECRGDSRSRFLPFDFAQGRNGKKESKSKNMFKRAGGLAR